MSDTNSPPKLTPNDALDLMGKFLDLATKRGAFNLLETEQIVRAISVFRVPAPVGDVPDAAPAAPVAPVSNESVTI